MVSCPFHMTFEFLPESQLFDTSDYAKTFTEFCFVVDFESDGIILRSLVNEIWSFFVLNLGFFCWFGLILIKSISIFVINLIFNHLKIIIIHNIWTRLSHWVLVRYAGRIRAQTILDFLIDIWSEHLLKSVILSKTHSSLGFCDIFLGRVALYLKTLLLGIG